jgi:hypothetical protein
MYVLLAVSLDAVFLLYLYMTLENVWAIPVLFFWQHNFDF